MRVKLLSFAVIVLFSSVIAFAALDLAFTTAITQSPDPVSAGAEATFTVSFRTNGGAVTNMKIIGGVDGTQLYDRAYASIAADKTRTDSFTWTATAGNHTVWFELDPNHTCGDSNYSNNRIEKAITVSGGAQTGQPDLTPVVAYSPSKFEPDNEVEFSIIIFNKGDKMSKGCEMQVVQNGIVIDTKIVPTVLPVSSNVSSNHWHMTYKWKAVCAANVEFKLDSNNMNDESNEDNNTWSKKMTCHFKMKDYSDAIAPVSPVSQLDPNGPDLTVKIIEIWKYSEEKYVILFEYANIGKAKSVPCNLTVKKHYKKVYDFIIPALDIGQTTRDTYMVDKVCGEEWNLHIDSDFKNIESNENNNTAKDWVKCSDE